MKEGLHHARRDPVLLALMSSKATFAIGAGTVSLLAVLVTEVFDGGDGTTGLLLGMRGLGVALGPLIASRLIGPSLSRLLTTCGLAGLVFGTCYLGVSVAGSLALAALLVFVGHLGGGAQWTMSTFGLQLRAPDEVRGRILAADFAFLTLILTFTTTAAGALATRIGPQATMGIFAGISLTTGTAYLVVTRRLRHRLRAEEDSAAADRPRPRASARQDRSDGFDQAQGADVAVQRRVHAVHGVAEADVAVGVREGQRAARPGVPERARAEHRREQARRHEAHAERGREHEHPVGLVRRA